MSASARTVSPLRYPGGKTCLHNLLWNILKLNGMQRRPYAEPYAGGCGLALSLLYGGHVSDIYINDLDRSIWSFWHCVLNHTDALARLIESTPVTLDEWHRQRLIHRTGNWNDPLSLGFATFFLNRTNRSGVIKSGGAIGGMKQDGAYKLDCRFNVEDLVRRVRRVAKYRSRIHLSCQDALEFMSKQQSTVPGTFFCIDPPYFSKGASLYTNYYGPAEHASVADAVKKLRCSWIVTYDDATEVRELYKGYKQNLFDINYSVQTKRVGSELLIAPAHLRLPEATLTTVRPKLSPLAAA